MNIRSSKYDGRKACQLPDRTSREMSSAYLEPLVLQHLFNGHHLLAVNKASLVHHTKRAITDHLQGVSKVTS